MCYNLWYNAPTMLPATGRQHRGCIIPQAVTQQSNAPEDGRDHRPKHVELIGIDKPLLLHLVGVYINYSNDARSNKYQIPNNMFGQMQGDLKFKVICKIECFPKN